MKFRKKPVIIEAEQYHRNAKVAPMGVCTGQCEEGSKFPHVHTMHDNQAVRLKDGDWVIPEPDGVHFYPCDADVFAKTYEVATATAQINLPKIIRTRLEILADDLGEVGPLTLLSVQEVLRAEAEAIEKVPILSEHRSGSEVSGVAEEKLKEHRIARAFYWQAIDDIYNDGEEGRDLVIKHFGLWHPPYHRQDEEESPAPSAPSSAEQKGT